MRVYISGPISNKRIDARTRFGFAAKLVGEMGHFAVNPMTIIPYNLIDLLDRQKKKGEWNYYMRESLKLMMECDGIYMLDGWEKSSGAILEKKIAHSLEFEVLYQTLESATDALNLDTGNYGQEEL